jgi:hypothetical protein
MIVDFFQLNCDLDLFNATVTIEAVRRRIVRSVYRFGSVFLEAKRPEREAGH